MRVRIGQIEIIDPTPEEFDALVAKYGGAEHAENGSTTTKAAGKGVSETPRDLVVLRSLVEAGTVGVPNMRIGALLGRGGKAMRGAAQQWAARIGLTHDADADPFESLRVGTARGIRIKPDLQALALELLKGGPST